MSENHIKKNKEQDSSTYKSRLAELFSSKMKTEGCIISKFKKVFVDNTTWQPNE